MASPTFRAAGAITGLSAGSSPLSIPTPAGVAEDDFLVLFWGLASHGGTGSGRTPPSGFTQLDAVEPTTDWNGWAIYYKIAGSGEPGSYAISQTSNIAAADYAFFAAWSGVDTASPIDAVGTKYSDDAVTTPDVLSVTAASADTTLIALCLEWSGANRVIGVSSSGMTQRGQRTALPSFLVADEAIASAGDIGLKQFSSDFTGYFFTYGFTIASTGGGGGSSTTPLKTQHFHRR